MSLADLIAGHASSVFLNTEHFAVAATQITGTTSTARTVWFEELDPAVFTDRGTGTERRARLAVSDSVTVSVQDRWTISNETWEVVSIKNPRGGLVELEVKRRDDEFRNGKPGTVL